MTPDPPAVIVTVHNEAARLADTLSGLRQAFPGARILIADDASSDGSEAVATAAGAEVVRIPQRMGKGGAATLAVRRVTGPGGGVVLCDGDLGTSAGSLGALERRVREGGCDLAVGSFASRRGGGFGLAVGVARWSVRRLCGVALGAPLSGQRALRTEVLDVVLPFSRGFGMEVGMTVDAVRAGFRVCEVELELEHRVTGRTVAGFLHRGRQLVDVVAAHRERRRGAFPIPGGSGA
jgi:glycosyltransferase involved in cell wall biosynthesis